MILCIIVSLSFAASARTPTELVRWRLDVVFLLLEIGGEPLMMRATRKSCTGRCCLMCTCFQGFISRSFSSRARAVRADLAVSVSVERYKREVPERERERGV